MILRFMPGKPHGTKMLWLAGKYARQGGGQIRLQEFCAPWHCLMVLNALARLMSRII